MMVIRSFIKTVFSLISGRLSFPKRFVGERVQMEDGLTFKIFRHMKMRTKSRNTNEAVFIVRFRFNKLSHETNIRLSRIPIPLIAGFPGFRDKIWMIDQNTGYWQGIYQWENEAAIEKYKKSFVLGIMNKRAVPDTLSYKIVLNVNIDDYVNNLIWRKDD